MGLGGPPHSGRSTAFPQLDLGGVYVAARVLTGRQGMTVEVPAAVVGRVWLANPWKTCTSHVRDSIRPFGRPPLVGTDLAVTV
jgi:hypothetical protein